MLWLIIASGLHQLIVTVLALINFVGMLSPEHMSEIKYLQKGLERILLLI